MADTFQELAVTLANKQEHMIDAVSVGAPLIAAMPMQRTTHGLFHTFEQVNSITGGSYVDMNAALPAMDVKTDLGTAHLKIMGGKIVCPQDQGPSDIKRAEYFAKKAPKTITASAETAEADIVYNSLRQYAIDNENYLRVGTSGDAFYSILAVTWVEDEICGLYDPDQFNDGEIFNMGDYWNGGLGENSDGVPIYQKWMKTYLGILLANPKKVALYANLNASNLPTAKSMDELLLLCENSQGSNTVLYMHPRMKNYLKNLKNANLTTIEGDSSIFRGFEAYDDVPIVTSYNFKAGTETAVAAIS